MEGGLDAYATLGVPEDASIETIQVAYRRLVFEHHPDTRVSSLQGRGADSRPAPRCRAQPRCPPPLLCPARSGGAGDHARFAAVHEAYRTLRDPARRQRYDALRHAGPSSPLSGAHPGEWPRAQPSADGSADFERRFEEWLRRAQRE